MAMPMATVPSLSASKPFGSLGSRTSSAWASSCVAKLAQPESLPVSSPTAIAVEEAQPVPSRSDAGRAATNEEAVGEASKHAFWHPHPDDSPPGN